MFDYLNTKIQDLKLPDLPYAYNALDPVVSQRIMTLHHDKHHNGYYTKLLDGVKGTKVESMTLLEAFKSMNSLPESTIKTVQNNGGGFVNHSLFWEVLTPEYKEPTAGMTSIINDSFGSMEKFVTKFSEQALSVFGSGWTFLVVSSGKKLQIVSTPNQNNPLMSNETSIGTPVFGLDVWEHAYYLDYENRRNEYVENIWKVVNWEKVGELIEAA